MLNNTSIQEIPSIEEVSPTKLRPDFPLKNTLGISSGVLSRLSVDSGRSSPELKRCSILCPKDKPNVFHYESQIEKILKKTNRSINEAVLLYKNIKNFDFFRKFKADHNGELCTTEALLHLCRSMKFETFFPGAIIYRKDEDSNQKVYLVFSGRVATATEAQEYAAKESPQKKLKAAKTLNCLEEEEDELNPSQKKDLKQSGTYKKLIPQKNSSKGSDGSPKYSPGVQRTNTKKDSGLVPKSKAKNGVRMSAGEMTDKELADWKSKCSLEVLIERKTTKESSIVMSPKSIKINEIKRENSRPGKGDESPAEKFSTAELTFKQAIRSNTIAFFGKRSLSSQNLFTNKAINSPSNRLGSDYQPALQLVPQITPMDTIGEARFVGDEEPQGYADYPQGIDTIAGTLETSLLRDKNFTSNPSKEKITEEDLLEKEDLSESMDSIEDSIEEDKEEMVTTKKKFGIRKGGTFGDEVLRAQNERKDTMVATVFTKVLTFTIHDYDYITTRFEKSNTKRLNFLLDHVPGLEKAIKYDKIKNVETHFQELEFSLHNHIVREGEKGKNIYLLVEGMCKIFKEPVDPLNQSQFDSRPSVSNLDTPRKKMEGAADKILMCIIQPGAFIGEEILFQESKSYQYTVKAASASVKVLAIKKSTFRRIMPYDVVNKLKDLHNSRYEHKKIMFAKKMSATLSVPGMQGNNLLKRFSSISACKDLVTSFSKRKMSRREQLESSIYDSWNGQDTPRSMAISTSEPQPHSLATAKTLTLMIPKSQRTLSQDEVSTQDKELSRTPRKLLTASHPALIGKTWDTYHKLHPLEANKHKDSNSLSPERTMVGSIQRLKSSFTKFGHLSTLEVPSVVDVSIKKPNNEVLPRPSPKSRQNFRASATNFNTSVTQLPKIDPTDIEGLRFDFGENKKEKEPKKEVSKRTGKCISLQNSREASPRNVVPLICMVSPKNANYLFKHTMAKSGSVITPKALLESCREIKEEMQAKSLKKKRSQAFIFPAVINPSPMATRTPKSEQNSVIEKAEFRNTSTVSTNISTISNDPLRSAIKNRTNRLILKAGVLGKGCLQGGSRNPSEGRQSAERVS